MPDPRWEPIVGAVQMLFDHQVAGLPNAPPDVLFQAMLFATVKYGRAHFTDEQVAELLHRAARAIVGRPPCEIAPFVPRTPEEDGAT